MTRTLSLFILFFMIYSCSDRKVNTEAYKREQKKRAVKHVTEGEINQYANKKGKEITGKITPGFHSLLQKQDSTVAYTYSQFKSTLEAIKRKNNMVKDFRLYPVSPDTTAKYPKEKSLWEAYQYNLENNIKQEDNIQAFEDSLFLYTRPLTVKKDTSDSLKGMWSLVLSKKQLIIEMPQE